MILIPEELLEQFQRGNVIPLVGSLINEGVLPTRYELAQELAGRCNYPTGEAVTLERVASYYLLTTHDRHGLITFLRDRLELPGVDPSPNHRLLTQLRPRVVMTSCYDSLLERAAQEAEIAYTPVIRNAEVAYGDDQKMMLVWLCGALEQPDSMLVTEDDLRRFLSGRESLSDVLRGELARRTWLFIGIDPEEEWFPNYYDSITEGLDHHRRRAYLVGSPTSPYTRAWWSARAQVLDAELEPFLTELVRQLEARRQPPSVSTTGGAVAVPAPIVLPERPYKLLDFYAEADADIFFGRELETRTLTSRIHAHRLTLLYGASGTGKTSLLLAGVVPRLTQSESGYEVLYLRALDELDAAIRRAIRRRCPQLELTEATNLVEFLDAAAAELGSTLVLIMDQFEEFFIRFGPERRQRFIAELGELYDARDVPVKIVLSLREDWLAEMNEVRERIPELFYIDLRLLPLTRAEARQAIVGPAERVGMRYDPLLVEKLLDDLTEEPTGNENALVMPPQLQLVCDALYERASGEGRRWITVKDYESVGGVQGILVRYIEEALQEHRGGNREIARGVLMALVTSHGTKAGGTSGEQLATELGITEAELLPILGRLLGQRLVRRLEDGGKYELAHDILATTLSGWIGETDRRRKQVQEMLRREVADWREDPAVLLGWAKFERVHALRDELRLAPDEVQFMLRSAILFNEGVPFWLERMGDVELQLDTVLEMLQREPAARLTAARMLGQFAQERAGVALAQAALQDPDRAVRDEAAASLAANGNAAALQLLSEAARHNPKPERGRAMRALAIIKERAPELLSSEDNPGVSLLGALATLRWQRSWPAMRMLGAAGALGGALAFVFGLSLSLGLHTLQNSTPASLVLLMFLLVPLGLLAGALLGLGIGAGGILLPERESMGRIVGAVVLGGAGFVVGLFPWVTSSQPGAILLELLGIGLFGAMTGLGIAWPMALKRRRRSLSLVGAAITGAMGLLAWGLLGFEPFQNRSVPLSLQALSGGLTGLILALALTQVTSVQSSTVMAEGKEQHEPQYDFRIDAAVEPEASSNASGVRSV